MKQVPALIAFEGIDGVGKSTHLRATNDFLTGLSIPNLATQELGGSDIGKKCRELLMHDIDPTEELLAISLARRWHFRNIVEPAIAEGKIVLIDRFIESTWAYQVGGHCLQGELVEFFQHKIWGAREPDFTIYIFGQSHRKTEDRFETAGEDFYNKVVAQYNCRKQSNWLNINTQNTFEYNQNKIEAFLKQALGLNRQQ